MTVEHAVWDLAYLYRSRLFIYWVLSVYVCVGSQETSNNIVCTIGVRLARE